MSRRPNSVPTYRLHKPSGQAVITLRLPNGSRKDIYLGVYDSPESRQEYARILGEVSVAPITGVAAPTTNVRWDLTVNELLLAFLEHARRHYRHPDGRLTSEIHNWNKVVQVTGDLYGHSLVREFGPLALKAIRQRLIDDELCRKVVNRRVAGVRHIFKWGMGEELVTPEVYTALTAISGLQKGRTSAYETEPVEPVDDAVVDATLPHLNRVVAGLIEFIRHTGCRPGEACMIRRCDIDTGGAIWLYRPPHHKTAHRGKCRTVAIGPKAQEVLREFFTPHRDDYLFSPRLAVEELLAERSANRQTPRYPSHMARNTGKRVRNRRRPPHDHYQTTPLNRAVARACDAAFPPPKPLAQREDESLAEWDARLTEEQKKQLTAWRKAYRWHVNQLQPDHATRVRKEFGLEAAGAALGHAKMSVTEVYAERDANLAATVAAKIG